MRSFEKEAFIMNYLHIAGHLGSDPEVRFTSSGKKVTVFRVAVNSRKGGKEVTLWWRVTIWGDLFEKMMPYLKKGSPVIVHGEMQKPEIFNDREGKPQISLEITATHLEFSPFGRGGERNSSEKAMEAEGPFKERPSEESSFNAEEEVPF